MTAQRWQEIEEAFLSALDLPETSRADFLAGLEESLRAEVAGMLDAHADDRLLPALLPLDPQPGMRIGPYCLMELIGKGGMGLVFRAERSDGQLPGQVALKLIRSQLADVAVDGQGGEGRARFRIERQVLALLEHPNIVRLLDGGVMDDGTPYLVMELVEGEPITRYCDARKLDTDARLALFQTVCSAIGQAHRQLVIHRDIKPANIVVTAAGDVKVLDFGIAKLLAPPPGQEDVTTHRAPLTPAYASPEQIRGENVTVASDIYSLGAVLYELLAGVPARQNSSDAPGAYVAREPTRPSAAAVRNGSQLRIGSDLDSIVLKAMAVLPADRYSSVEMERDIEFYLQGSPVMARQATLRYVLGKALRRHRLKFVAAAAAVLMIAGAIVWDARRVANEKNHRYEQIFEVARTMIVDMEDRIKDLPGSLEARKALAARALIYLESLRKEAAGDSRFETELARTYLQMADLQAGVAVSNLGDAKGAAASLEAARQLSESVLSREPGHVEASQSLARYYAAVAINRQYARDLEHARVAAEKSLEIRRTLAAAHPTDAGILYDVAAATQVLAAAIALSDPKRSEALFVDSSRLINRLLERDPRNRVLLRSAALAAKNISGRFSERRQFTEALRYAERARHLDEGLLEANPKDRGGRLDLSFDLCSIGWLQHDAGELAGAVRGLRDCVDIRRQLVSEEPKDIRARDRLAYASMLLAETLLAMDEREGAMAEAEAAIREGNEVIRVMPSMEGTTLVQLSNAYRIRAMVLELAGRRAAACDEYRKASQGFDRLDQLGRATSFANREAEAARNARAHCDG